jgi:hypothetical protein
MQLRLYKAPTCQAEDWSWNMLRQMQRLLKKKLQEWSSKLSYETNPFKYVTVW